jgi:hypothetical protein
MQATWTSLKYSTRSIASLPASLLLILAVCASGVMVAQAPAVVISQATSLAAFPAGGALASSNPAGNSFAVNSNGDIITGNTYGNQVLLISGKTGAVTVLGAYNNVGPVTLDSQNNLYVGGTYTNNVVKVPYVNGTYAPLSAPASATSPAVCTGNDTTECNFGGNLTNAANGYYFGLVSMAFDAQGDFFFGMTNANTAPNAIFECTVACLSTGTPAATLLYQEPTGTPATTGQLNIGAMSVDASENLFFTDSSISTAGANESTVSNLNELVYTAGTGYAATPTVLQTMTPATPGQYDDEIDAVAVAANGTVYFGSQDSGVYAFPNSGGAINTANVYGVSPQKTKAIAIDSTGNLYVVSSVASGSSNVDTMFEVTVGSASAPETAVGTPSTATNIVTTLNDVGCGSTPTIIYAAASGGSPSTQFTASAGTTCSGEAFGSGSSFPTTLNFNPAAVGLQSATLTATDSNGGTGTANVTGNATGMVATPTFLPVAGTYSATQTVTINDVTPGATIFYTTDGSTPTINSSMYNAPITVATNETVSAIAVGTGDTNSTVATAAYVINLAGAPATPTFSLAAGTFNTPQQITISDATAGAAIYYTTDGSAPTASSTLYTYPIIVSATATLKAVAIASATDSAVATALYTIDLPTSAFQNIVMTQSTSYGALGGGGSQSGSVPDGATMAVNSLGDVITGNTYGSQILLFTPQGGTPTVLGAVTNPNGVAVDSQNNLYIGFSYTSAVVKVPFVSGAYATLAAAASDPPYPSGTPNCTGTDTVECVMNNVAAGGADILSMIFDAQGDMFYASGLSGGTNNAIFECAAACLYTGTPAPTEIFQEPTSSSPTTTGQLNLGGLALDAAGDLFFTDSAVNSTTTQESYSSNLNELVYTSGTGYAATPTVIYTYTPAATAQYGAEIDGVAVAANGTVYALIEAAQGSQSGSPATGILAFPKVSGVYSNTTMYLASTQQGKGMTSDGLGNLYIADDGGNIYQVAVDSLTAPTAPQGNPSTATNIITILNDGGCTATPPTVTFAATGTSAAAFSAVTTGTCAGTATGGASYGTTLTFTPTATGSNTATLTATDSLGNTGAAAVMGTGTPAPPAATPTFSVPAGTYTTVQSVTIADTTTGAVIYYTIDGSTPTSASTVYSAPVSVSTTETLSAIALAPGFASSPVASALYTINLPTAATPTFSVTAGTYTAPQTVSIADTTAGAAIYFTVDGSTPTAKSTLYTAPITVGVTETINAIAVATNYNNSTVGSAAYTINLPAAATPAFSVAAGAYTAVQSVSITDSTTGAVIYYTTDGSTPTPGSGTAAVYSAPILVPASLTINAIAVASPNYNNSAVATAAYVITLPAPAFTIVAANATVTATPGGTGTATLNITANSAFNGTISFACSGFLPPGATCAFSPTNVTVAALGNSTAKLTVTVPAKPVIAGLRQRSGPLFAGVMAAGMLCLIGLRKRRGLQMLMMLIVSAVGLSMFSGCTTTSSAGPTSSQMVVTATGGSCAITSPGCTNPTAVAESVDLVLTVQ